MYRKVSVALAIIIVFYAPAFLFAQNTPFNPNYQSNLLFKSVNFFHHDLSNVQTFSVTPVELTQNAAIESGSFLSSFVGPSFPLMKNEELIYEYWYNLKTQANEATQKYQKLNVDHKVFNSLYNKPVVDEKKVIRTSWKEAFGVDVWLPYYKVKEVEDWVSSRMSVKVFGFKGKPKFENDQFVYVFKKTF